MKQIIVGEKLAIATCDVLGIDHKAHPVLGVEMAGNHGDVAEIIVRFAVPYGLLTQIDSAALGVDCNRPIADARKVGAGETAVTQVDQPDIHPALKPFQAEYDAAALAGDIETCKAIVMRAGLEWLDDTRKVSAGETAGCNDEESIERDCDAALAALKQEAEKLPYDSNIVCQALIELAAEYENSGFLENLHGRVDSAVMKIKPMIMEVCRDIH